MSSDNMIEWSRRLADAVEQILAERSGRPEVTYRVQFQKDRFTFADAAGIAGYLRDLGASHLYCSPYLKARPGSPHGYDVVDHNRLNPELGSVDDFAGLVAALRERGLGQIADIVPNHMGIATNENAWWNDVLENGPSSPYAKYFDIDWRPFKVELKNKVLLPVLGGQYGQVLESGQLQLEYRDGAFVLHYYEMAFPIEPRSSTAILTHRLDELREAVEEERQRREEASALGLTGSVEPPPAPVVSTADETPLPQADALLELESIVTALEYLPDIAETGPDRVAQRQREKDVIKGRLHRLTAASAAMAEFVERNVREFNGDSDDPRSFDRLDELLNAQAYRLSHWKAASDEINYRRFFDINDLAALSMEEPEVFEDTHRLIFELLVRGDVHGLRIDHIDGLFDPAEYLRRLQWGYCLALGRAVLESLRGARLKHIEAPAATTQRAVGAKARGSNPQARGSHPQARGSHPAGTATIGSGDGAAPLPFGLEFEPFEPLGEPPQWDEIEALFFNAIFERLGPVDIATVAADEIVPPIQRPPLYVAVEKILEPDEHLPQEWPVAGTTGYDFLNMAGGLFADPKGLSETVKTYARFTGERLPFDEVAYQSKMLILRVSMSSELQLLTYRINRLSEQHRRTRDFTLNNLRVALREILACFPVYRTYISAVGISERDRHFLNAAVARAKRRTPAMDPAIFDFIRDTLLLEQPPELDERGQHERALFVGRFQQVTSPVMAKGVEDTAFYRYFPLVSLNEVGGAPAHAATSIEEFHRENRVRLSHRPQSLIGTTTHDTKRSEDVRARISVLSEVPQLWRKAINRWSRFNRRFRRQVDGLDAPSRNDEYLFYQTLAGMWPLERREHPKPAGGAPREPATPSTLDPKTHQEVVERLQQYMEKATHEAKQRTSWVNPNPEYNDAVREFVARVLENSPKNRFLPAFLEFHEQVVDWGLYTALSQCLLKLASPGVPDIYQGQELWDFSLVDPDNRRPVDFDLRRWLLSELQATVENGSEALLELARYLAHNPSDNRLKLLVTWRMITFRRRYADLFERGEYIPLKIEGPQADHACAFAWRWSPPDGSGEDFALVVAPRLLAGLTPLADSDAPPPRPPLGPDVWNDTQILLPDGPPGPLKNLFTGQEHTPGEAHLPLANALADFPLAVLSSRGD